MGWRNIDHPGDGGDKSVHRETDHKRKSKQNRDQPQCENGDRFRRLDSACGDAVFGVGLPIGENDSNPRRRCDGDVGDAPFRCEADGVAPIWWSEKALQAFPEMPPGEASFWRRFKQLERRLLAPLDFLASLLRHCRRCFSVGVVAGVVSSSRQRRPSII